MSEKIGDGFIDRLGDWDVRSQIGGNNRGGNIRDCKSLRHYQKRVQDSNFSDYVRFIPRSSTLFHLVDFLD